MKFTTAVIIILILIVVYLATLVTALNKKLDVYEKYGNTDKANQMLIYGR